MWGPNDINSDATMAKYEQSSPDRAFKNIQDVLTALSYLRDSTVSARLVNQASRAGAMLKSMDETYVPRVKKSGRTGDYPAWKAVGLESEWNAWIRGRADKVRAKAESYIQTYLGQLQEGYATQAQRDVAEKGGNDPQAVQARALIEKIDALAKAVNAAPRWNNPF